MSSIQYKGYNYTPTKSAVSQSTNYTQAQVSSRITSVSDGKYTGSPLLRASHLARESKLRDVQERYEREVQEVQKNYERHYQDQFNLGNSVKELQEVLEMERKKVLSLETRLSECYREMEQEKRQKLELARENTELRANVRKKETVLTDFEFKVTNVQQNATSVNYENDSLRHEVKRLSDTFNAKLKEMEEKYKKEVQDFNDEVDNLRSQLKQRDIDNEAKIREVSRGLEAKVRSLENQLREKDRIIEESESELKSLKEFNMKIKMEFEEELRRRINIIKDEDRVKYEGFTKSLETRVNELEMENDSLKRNLSEIGQDLKNKEKMVKEVKLRYDEQLGTFKKENMDLKDQLSLATSEIERLQGELGGKDSAMLKLQNEVLNLNHEIAKHKESYLQEINRLMMKNDADIKRFQDYERQLKARIVDLERLLKASEGEASKLRTDLEKLREQIAGNISKTISQTFGEYGGRSTGNKATY